MVVIFAGVALTTLGAAAAQTSNSPFGIACALLAGLSFGLYGIFSERALQSKAALHPVPFSLVTFIIVSGSSWSEFAGLTACQHCFNAVATCSSYDGCVCADYRDCLRLEQLWHSLYRRVFTALISGSTPALTALLAWAALQEALQSQQVLGVGLVTVGVAALSLKAKQQR